MRFANILYTKSDARTNSRAISSLFARPCSFSLLWVSGKLELVIFKGMLGIHFTEKGAGGYGLSLDSALSTPISHLAFSLSSSGLAEAPGGTAAQESVVLA